MKRIDEQRISELRAAWAADRSIRVEHWRKHWRMEVFEFLSEMGFAGLLGVAFSLAVVLWALEKLQ